MYCPFSCLFVLPEHAFQTACSAEEGLIINSNTEDHACHTADGDEIPLVSVTADCRAAIERLITNIRNADEIDCFISAVARCLFDELFRIFSYGELTLCNIIGRKESDV